MRSFIALLAMALAALPALGQGTELQNLLAGNTHPLSKKLSDLDGDWRRLSTGGQSEGGGLGAIYSAMFGGAGGAGFYYTRGQTVTIGGETYLVAYSPRTKPMDFSSLMRPGASGPPKQEKLKADTPLSLSLLNLRTTGSLLDIREFDLKQELADSESASKTALDAMGVEGAATEEASSVGNLKQIGLALMMYVQDYDEVLPPMKDAASVKKLLMPYVKNEAAFVDPATKQPFQPNPALSRKKLAHITQPSAMVAFYEASAASDGTRGVAFLDGSAKRVSASDWTRLKRASKIP